jgi:DNA-binding response OmpR family regulator
MITANEGGRHKAYAEMLGVDAYLRKPFAVDVLLEQVQRIFGMTGSPVDLEAMPPQRTSRRKPT